MELLLAEPAVDAADQDFMFNGGLEGGGALMGRRAYPLRGWG